MIRNILASAIALHAAPALAQGVTNNAVTASDDAFGRAVGNERTGIYSSEEVRGFNPIEAGNVRIEGLYFDQQGMNSNRLIDSSAIRVGYAAQGYPFPAPTGIVDQKLEKFEGQTVSTVDLDVDPGISWSGSITAKMALAGDKLGVSFGSGFRIATQPHGRFGKFNSQAILFTWHPVPEGEITAFWTRFGGRGAKSSPVIFPLAGVLPPEIDRRADFSQDWADGANTSRTYGVIGKIPLGDFRLAAGLFRSKRHDIRSFADLMTGVDAAGVVANRIFVADEENAQGSTSGEVRITREWKGAKVRHMILATVKGRDQARSFGGQSRIAVGPSNATRFVTHARPAFVFGTNDESAVKQFTFGLGYDLGVRGLGSLAVAVQKADYRKTVDFANPALANAVTTDKPWLFSVNATTNIANGLVAYGGYVRGLEESAIAPDIAINRSEAPPALRTRQMDAGLRYTIRKGLNVIAGVFQIEKPYFNLDATQRFGQLGDVRYRGVEVSLAGSLGHGVTLIAGAVLLDPRISGIEVDSGRIGPRPVGSSRRRAIANLDWKPAGQTAWSFDLALEAVGPEMANIANSFSGPARQTLGSGVRYRFNTGAAKWLARVAVTNIFDDYSYRVSPSGGFAFTPPRSIMFSLTGDI